MKLTVSEAASLLGSGEDRVHRWIEDDDLPAQKIRGMFRINRTDLLEWATEHNIGIAPRAFQEGGNPSLADALRAGGVHHRIEGSDLSTVLRNLVEQLPLADPADREMLLQILLARRTLGLMPVGDGIAIPQVRMPIILAPSGAVLALSFVSLPLDLFGGTAPVAVPLSTNSPDLQILRSPPAAHAAQDDGVPAGVPGDVPVSNNNVRVPGAATPPHEPIDTFFLLICPTIHIHLAMLAKLAFALKDPAFRAAVRGRASAAEIVRIAMALEAEV